MSIKVDVVFSGDQADGVSDNEALRRTVERLTASTSVTWRDTGVRTGGGWPEVEFEGSPSEIELVAWRYAHGPSDDVNHILTELLRSTG